MVSMKAIPRTRPGWREAQSKPSAPPQSWPTSVTSAKHELLVAVRREFSGLLRGSLRTGSFQTPTGPSPGGLPARPRWPWPAIHPRSCTSPPAGVFVAPQDACAHRVQGSTRREHRLEPLCFRRRGVRAKRKLSHLLRYSVVRCSRADLPSRGRSEPPLAAHDRATSATGVCLRCGDAHTGRYSKCRCGRRLPAIVECHLPARFGPDSAERRTLAGTSCARCTCRGCPRANHCPSFSSTPLCHCTLSVLAGSKGEYQPRDGEDGRSGFGHGRSPFAGQVPRRLVHVG